ncbi:MAG: Muramoyltetrapeptide carboxypeptidase [Candidatus Kapaibacterium sp.]|nr:MAG: Muramoyltetrapeptide carboxypeptidase [Candidatus Kapabacteria bacterium]
MLTRRQFTEICTLALFGLNARNLFSLNNKQKDKLIKPKALKTNDTVGIVAPGTAVPSPDDLFRANEIIFKLGLRAKFGKSISKGTNYRTRTVQERLDDLMEMFLDSDVRAIFCIRGGYGSGQLLDKIDYSIVRNNPKIFLGYSDITALHIAFNRFANLVTYHGPVLLSSFTKYTFDNLSSVIFGKEKRPTIQNPVDGNTIRTTHYIRTIYSGKTEGKVVGGNLSIITSLLGTSYEYDFNDALLVIEDVGEEPYRIDRMLNHLRLAGVFEKANGIVFGECNDCIATSQNVWDLSLGEVLDNYLLPLRKPSFYGLCIGHTQDQSTFAIGPRAELDASAGKFTYLEDVIE